MKSDIYGLERLPRFRRIGVILWVALWEWMLFSALERLIPWMHEGRAQKVADLLDDWRFDDRAS